MKKKALTQNIQISVVLPVYNEQNNIEALSREIISVLGNLQFSRLELVCE